MQVETNLSFSSGCKKSVKIRLVEICYLQTYYNLLKQQFENRSPNRLVDSMSVLRCQHSTDCNLRVFGYVRLFGKYYSEMIVEVQSLELENRLETKPERIFRANVLVESWLNPNVVVESSPLLTTLLFELLYQITAPAGKTCI